MGCEDLKISGITPFTGTDYPGKLSCAVFVQGCPWKCLYCHNPHMQPRRFDPRYEHSDWESLAAFLKKRKGLLDAAVFSGGEPTMDPALPDAAKAVKEMGFLIGLHTSGCYPERLKEVLPYVSWAGLDIKAPPMDRAVYTRIAGTKGEYAPNEKALESLDILLRSGVPFECRTTAHPAYLSAEQILETASFLKNRGVAAYALQIYHRPEGLDLPYSDPDRNYPGPEIEKTLTGLFPSFTLRRA